MLSPIMALIGAVFAFGTSFLLHYLQLLNITEYFFAPVFLLILFHTVVMQWAKRPKNVVQPRAKIIIKSILKYLFWMVLIQLVFWLYDSHDFYRRFAAHTKNMVAFYQEIYLYAGLPYFLFIERFRSSRFDWVNDAYLKVHSLIKLLFSGKWARLRQRITSKRYKSLLLSGLLRVHFIPIMVEQVYWGVTNTSNYLANPSAVLLNVGFLVGLLFLLDSINASIGYFWESALTRTRFRVMDTNAFHWFVVLICYMPFISYASNFIAFPSGSPAQGYILTTDIFQWVWHGLMVICLLGIVLATTCLGFSYSNLCYKKIQTRGPYAIVRHPGTVFKILFFFLSVFQYKAAYTLPILLAYVFWMGVYIMRILCEERFLMQFKEYQDYVQQTRYRLIPGVW